MSADADTVAAPPPDLEQLLEESEHQAFDLLDALSSTALGEDVWRRLERASEDPELEAELRAALAREGETPASLREATSVAQGALLRVLAIAAGSLLDAARGLATQAPADAEALGLLAPEIETVMQQLREHGPQRSAALSAALETTQLSLGLDPDGLSCALLTELAAGARREASDELLHVEAGVRAALSAAWPRVEASAPLPTLPLRVFRSASVMRAGPSIRARALTAEHPEHLALAERLVAAERDPAKLIVRFDATLASVVTAKSTPALAPKQETPAAMMDGPKRPFTRVHVALALLVLGLTLWHYLWR